MTLAKVHVVFVRGIIKTSALCRKKSSSENSALAMKLTMKKIIIPAVIKKYKKLSRLCMKFE